MPIDARLLLQAQPTNLMQSIAGGLQTGEQLQNSKLAQLMNQQKLEQGQMALDEYKQQAPMRHDEEFNKYIDGKFKSDYYGAMQILPMLDSGNVDGAQKYMEQHIAQGKSFGADMTDEEEFLNGLKTNPQQAKQHLSDIVSFGKQLYGDKNATAEYNNKRLKIDQQNADANTLRASKLGAKGTDGGVGPEGKSVDAWATRTLLNGDPSSSEYAAAYNELSKPRTQYVQTDNGLMPVQTKPDMSAYRKPTSLMNSPIAGNPAQGAMPPASPDAQGGVIPGTTKPPTEDQAKAAGWYAQATNAYNNMVDAININPAAARPTLGQKAASVFGKDAETLASSPERLRYKNAASSFSEAVLRAATGAGITKDEAQQKIDELTPGLFDPDELVKQKQQAMLVYLDSLKTRAGNAGKGTPPPRQFDIAQPQGKPSISNNSQAPQQAIDYLKSNATPEIKSQFKAKYGYLPDGM